MIPYIDEELLEVDATEEIPSVDYKLDSNKINGQVESVDEIRQAIYFILNSERFEHDIYPSDYGFEVADLIGLDMEYVIPEAETRIKEALLQDDRIMDVTGFEFEVKKNNLHVTFEVNTSLGTIESEAYIDV